MIKDIEHINKAIVENLRKDNPEVDVLPYGLAESNALRGDEDVTIPAFVLPHGECINVYGETDKHDVTFYHRLNEISFQDNEEDSYGGRREYTEVADLSLIVFGKRTIVNPLRVENLARNAIAANSKCSIVRSDFNSLQVFASEYMGVTYFMTPDFFLFKINYRLTSTSRLRCINNNQS